MKEPFSKTVLPNGIRVLTEHMPHVHSVSLGIWVAAGSRDENDADSGISHFIEHMLFKGTRQRSALDIAKSFDQMGGLSNAFTTKENTCFHAKVLDSHLDRALELFADIILRSKFDSDEMEKERQVILQEISMVEDSPDDLIHDLFTASYWPGNGLGRSILGTSETVSAMAPERLKFHVARAYAGPTLLLVAAGSVDHHRLVDRVAGLFGDIPPRADLPRRTRPKPNLGASVIRKDLEQAHLLIGFEGPSATDPGRYPAMLMNVILGGSMSSRLFQEIRERRGLAYSIYSFLSAYEDVGTLGVYAGISPDEIATVTEIIQEEIAKIAREPVDPDELDAARDHVKGGLLLSAESTDARMTRLAKNEITLGKFVSYEEVLQALDAVTGEEIMTLAEASLGGGASMVCLGPVSDAEAGRWNSLAGI